MNEIKVSEQRDNEICEWTGYQIASKMVMDIDSAGIFFYEYEKDITAGTINASEAIRTHAITLPVGSSEVLKALDNEEIANMTIRDLALLLQDVK